jgi:hypothetical protein
LKTGKLNPNIPWVMADSDAAGGAIANGPGWVCEQPAVSVAQRIVAEMNK